MATDAQKRATAKYEKNNVKRVSLKFFPADRDIYDYLKSQDNMGGYLKSLIRKDMEQSQD